MTIQVSIEDCYITGRNCDGSKVCAFECFIEGEKVTAYFYVTKEEWANKRTLKKSIKSQIAAIWGKA